MAKATETASGSGAREATRDGNAQSQPAVSMRKELVENQMYETAAKLFAERGFAGTSLQDIADAMGITRPALYYYVKSKEDLLSRLVTEITAGNTAQILRVTNNKTIDPVQKLSEVAYLMAHNRALHPTRFLLLARSEAELPEDLAKVHETTKRKMLRNLIEVIQAGIDAGQFRPVNPRIAALAVIGMCNWVAWWFHEDDPASAEQVATDVADMAVASVLQAENRVTAATGPRAALSLLRQDVAYLERLLDDADKKR
ncbi:TetR/AcrR family transcriptional regulator [Mycobacterium sp. MOTT36Y]|uniref:TetR/AcrR family transcriptional regulator n=1 Tax=unclassified Mycobacterium TaxID=2642494 RepID=UPI00025D58DA|nr:TetR/AcrR family transcriptional regulator [Mycobacterium sp. MOTT36Y]AFJ34608.1 TetR family transcriptional regulator [Mycobacterium sp. MOTT36Y]